jgi:hypothetical protein
VSAYSWRDCDFREYFEVTTERMQYHWTGPRDEDDRGYSHWLKSAGCPVGSKATPWVAEIKPADEWVFIGEFRTSREAKAAAIAAFSRAERGA